MEINENRYLESLESDKIGEAWQYKMRRAFANEENDDKYWEKYDLSIQKSIVKEISYSEAKKVIEKYEWLGCMPVCVKHCYGLFFPSFSDNKDYLLGGGNCIQSRIRRKSRCMGQIRLYWKDNTTCKRS